MLTSTLCVCDESLLADVCPHLCIVTPGQQWEDVVSPSFGSFFNSHICSVSVLRLLYTVPSAFAVTPRNVCAGYMNRLVPTNCMSDTVLYGYGLSELQQSEKKCVLFLCNFKRLDLTRFYLVVFNCSNIFFKYKLWMFWFFFLFVVTLVLMKRNSKIIWWHTDCLCVGYSVLPVY